MPLDLTLAPIYRVNGQEITSLPGLIALNPPRTAARGREKDRLIVYLLLTGNAVFSTSEYMKVAQDAAAAYYQSAGSLTSSLKAASEHVNKTLLERNMSSSARGQYAIAWLTLAALRDTQCTLSMSGPMHAYWFGHEDTRHIHEPAVSGKGLGASQTINIHYAQLNLNAGDRLLFVGRAPDAWDSTLNDPAPSSLDAMRRRLTTLTSVDVNAVLMQATNGSGNVKLLDGTLERKKEETAAPLPTPSLPQTEETVSAPQPVEAPTEDLNFEEKPENAAHVVQPSAYAIPPQRTETEPANKILASLPRNTVPRDFPASIPRIQPSQQSAEVNLPPAMVEESLPIETEEEKSVEEKVIAPVKAAEPETPREPSEMTRQTAKVLATGIQSTRRINQTIGEKLRNFLPRLLPNSEAGDSFAPSNFSMFAIAVGVPLMVVAMLFVVYVQYGRTPQYEIFLGQAREMSTQAAMLTNPIEQRESWKNVLLYVDKAEDIYRPTSDTITLREQAEVNLDKLLGITRMQFNPAFSINLGIEVSRMAASETDLFLLNAANGEALRAVPASNRRGFELDTAFNCKPGVYGSYTVGPLVDILTMPTLNSINATLLGVDAAGNLLYCAPGQVAQAIPLPPPDTNWGRVTAFILDSGNLYVLDSSARAVWVYTGRDGTFIDRPYFFFGGQTPEKQDVIDLVVSGDDLYMLHADGHLSTCSYSRIESVPTRCQDPSPLINPIAAYQDTDLFGAAHFTQVLLTALPNQSILLLDADTQGVMRFTPRSLELQSQLRPTTGTLNPIPSGPVGAIAVGPNHVLYLAVGGQIYFATDMP
ncbi:MAG TPA: hypothetical protein PKE43_12590 [Anaerolineales bacterium]|nr:hypothetical protein [Anaerolineales bacterium]